MLKEKIHPEFSKIGKKVCLGDVARLAWLYLNCKINGLWGQNSNTIDFVYFFFILVKSEFTNSWHFYLADFREL